MKVHIPLDKCIKIDDETFAVTECVVYYYYYYYVDKKYFYLSDSDAHSLNIFKK